MIDRLGGERLLCAGALQKQIRIDTKAPRHSRGAFSNHYRPDSDDIAESGRFLTFGILELQFFWSIRVCVFWLFRIFGFFGFPGSAFEGSCGLPPRPISRRALTAVSEMYSNRALTAVTGAYPLRALTAVTETYSNRAHIHPPHFRFVSDAAGLPPGGGTKPLLRNKIRITECRGSLNVINRQDPPGSCSPIRRLITTKRAASTRSMLAAPWRPRLESNQRPIA